LPKPAAHKFQAFGMYGAITSAAQLRNTKKIISVNKQNKRQLFFFSGNVLLSQTIELQDISPGKLSC